MMMALADGESEHFGPGFGYSAGRGAAGGVELSEGWTAAGEETTRGDTGGGSGGRRGYSMAADPEELPKGLSGALEHIVSQMDTLTRAIGLVEQRLCVMEDRTEAKGRAGRGGGGGGGGGGEGVMHQAGEGEGDGGR